MSDHYAGDIGAQTVFPALATAAVNGLAITSVVVKARLPDGTQNVTWGYATILTQSLSSVTAVVASDGITNVLSGLYVLRATFFVGVNPVLSGDELVVLVKPARPGTAPVLPPPWDEVDSRLDVLEGRTYEAVRAVLTSGAASGLTVDGVTLTAGQRVLRAVGTEVANGIYLAAAGAWTRATDMAAAAVVILGGIVPVLEGSAANVGIWRMSAPTTGSITVGTTAVGWAQASGGGGTVATGSVVLPVVLRNQALVASGSGPLILARAQSGHVANTTTTIEISEYTHDAFYPDPSFQLVSLATGLPYVAADFDDTKRGVVAIHYGAGRAWGTYQVLDRDATAEPSVIACIVPKADTDTLEIRSDGMYFATLPTIVPSVGAAVTVSGIKSYTPTRIILQLSRAILLTDVFEVVFAANGAMSLRGIALPAQSIAFFWHILPTALPGFTSHRDSSIDIASDGTWPVPAGVTDSVFWLQTDSECRPAIVANGYDGAPAMRFAPLVVTFDGALNEITTSNVYHGIDTTDIRVWFVVRPGGSGAMPTGLTEYTTYYARDFGVGPTKLKISATAGGAAIDFTGNGAAGVVMFFRKLGSTAQISSFTTTTQDTVFCACVPHMISRNVGVGFSKDQLLGGQGYFGIGVDAGVGVDTFAVSAIEYTTTDDFIETPCAEGAPMLICRTHGGGNMTISVDRKTPATVVSGTVTSTTAQLTIGCGNSDSRFVDLSVMALTTANQGPPSATDREGMTTWAMLESWGGWLRHDKINVFKQKAVVGVVLDVFWSQVHRVGNGVSQYTYELTGVGGTVDAEKWRWTPAGGDVGTHTATLVIKLGGRRVATRTFTVVVAAAAGTGTRRILPIGDSWTDGGVLHIAARDALIAQGQTVVMLGTRGGLNCTFDATTNLITLSGHGFSSGDVVRFRAGLPNGTLPTAVGGNIDEASSYFALVVDATTFRIERTLGGGAIDLTSAGVLLGGCIGPNQSAEGRAGLTWEDFFYGLRPQDVGASPFIDPATGKFSWVYYRTSKLAGVVPTDIVYQLGVNGLISHDPNDRATVDAYIDYNCSIAERFIRDVRASDPTIRNHLLVPSVPSDKSSFARLYNYSLSAESAARSMHRQSRRYVEQFGGREAENIFTVSVQNVDPATDFGDFFHCSTGYAKAGAAIAASIRVAGD